MESILSECISVYRRNSQEALICSISSSLYLPVVLIDCFHCVVQFYVNYSEDSDQELSSVCLYLKFDLEATRRIVAYRLYQRTRNVLLVC